MLIANPEYEYIFRSQKHCDDKVSEYGFDIGVLPEGKYALFEDNHLVSDAGGDEMISKDTCYLKLRAYMFWSYSNERKPLRFLDN